jgi:tRNA U34 5-carboxymethylaminomethyl modifying enzyme MnmG/GidA
MQLNDYLPYLTSAITGAASWLGAYLMATKKSKLEFMALEESNKHEIAKLMKRHEIDIESLKEKHLLELEKTNTEHKHKIEIMEIEHQNAITRKEHELEASAKYKALGEMAPDLMRLALDGSLPDIFKQTMK